MHIQTPCGDIILSDADEQAAAQWDRWLVSAETSSRPTSSTASGALS
jgi:hypothetical protein